METQPFSQLALRRSLAVALFSLLLLTLCSAEPAATNPGQSERPATPSAVLQLLVDGNARFVAGKSLNVHQDGARIRETAKGQKPFAAVLSCADSRVPVEMVFDQGIGDLFVVRVAGNVCQENETGSLEFGAQHLGCQEIVVMGHTSCGAVAAVCNGAQTRGSLPGLLDSIQPAVMRAKQKTGLSDSELVPAAVEENVWESIKDLLARSEIIRGMIRSGELGLVGAVYDLETGEVHWLGEHPRMKELVGEN